MSVHDHPTFNPMVSPYRDDPNPFYAWARREEPVYFSEALEAYLISRYDDIAEILNDPATFSSANAIRSMWASQTEEVFAAMEGLIPEARTIVNTDEPAHAELRGLVNQAFSGRRVRSMLPEMTQRADDLLASFRNDGRADLVAGYADPYVQYIVSTVFGVPSDDIEKVQAWTKDFLYVTNPLVDPAGKHDAVKRLFDYQDYVDALAGERRDAPREDFLSDLVHGTDQFPPVSRDDLHYIFRGLRLAGYDTTLHLITSTLYVMLQNERELWHRALDDRSVLPRIIEEAVRRESPHAGLKRVTTRETKIAGTTLPAGSSVLLLFGSANRDETRFSDPDAMQVDRANINDHVAFGNGIHQCPGQQLARAEVRVAVDTLLRELPDLRLAGDFRPEYRASYNHRGLERLDVTW